MSTDDKIIVMPSEFPPQYQAQNNDNNKKDADQTGDDMNYNWCQSNVTPLNMRLGRLDNANTDLKTVLASTSELAVDSQITITFQNLVYTVPVKGPAVPKSNRHGGGQPNRPAPKTILNDVSGVLRAGQLTAIMGASGAGKTSLLQILAGEAKNGTLGGQIRVNGEPTTGSGIKKLSAFVFQDDLLLPTATVHEAITMSALLRLPASIDLPRKQNRVDKMIELLNLAKAKNTVVGNAAIKGISGGERKRTAMAMELVTNPSVLFLDEPTSGLDTFTAHSVIKTLKALASTGRTVVTTIHQPSSDIFHMFDDLILMSSGSIVYQGPCSGVLGYFETLGYVCPPFTNPADFIFMDVLNNSAIEHNTQTPGETNEIRVCRVISHWPTTAACKEITSLIDASVQKYISEGSPKRVDKMAIRVPSSFWTQVSYLFGRVGRNAMRNPLVIRAKFAQTIAISIIIGCIFYRLDLKTGFAAYQDRSGFLFFLTMNNVMSSTIGVLSIFGGEKRVFAREYGAGYYNLLPYFSSKVAVEAPFYAFLPWLQTTLLYWTAGLQNRAENYAIIGTTVMLCSLSGFSLGIFFACIFSSLEVALGAAPLILMPLMLLSGLFVNLSSVPPVLSWIKYISPMKYGYESLIKTELQGLNLVCSARSNATVSGSTCVSIMGLDGDVSVAGANLVLLAMVFGLLVVGYLGMLSVVSKESRSVTSRSGDHKDVVVIVENKPTIQ